MPVSTIARHEDLLARLVHDLRQPLSNIETSVYLLNLWTPPDDVRSRAQLHNIESQLVDAARMLAEASAALCCLHGQRARESGSMDRTKPVTAGVT